MVATRPSNKSKHPGKVDLPAKRQEDTEDSDDEDDDEDDEDEDEDEDDVKKRRPPRKKPAPRRYQKAKKAAATEAIAQLELEMTEKDAQDSLQANRPPTSNVSKVPRKLSGKPKSTAIVRPASIRT
jgi:hypothetical protein